jgi:hypothetical protein
MVDEPNKKREGCAGCFGYGVVFILGAIVGGCLSNGVTRIALNQLSRVKQYEDERDAVAPVLARDPAFKDVHIGELSVGGIWMTGSVPTTADKNRLKELVMRALGEPRATELVVTHVEAKDEHK